MPFANYATTFPLCSRRATSMYLFLPEPAEQSCAAAAAEARNEAVNGSTRLWDQLTENPLSLRDEFWEKQSLNFVKGSKTQKIQAKMRNSGVPTILKWANNKNNNKLTNGSGKNGDKSKSESWLIKISEF